MNGPREIADREHFETIADRYARKDIAPSSRPARRHRVERTVAAVPIDHFDRVLEVGCGAGFGAQYLSGRYRDYLGIDHSRRLIELAVEQNSGKGARFEATNIDQFQPPWHFDLIIMIGVLHHLEEPSRSMQKMVQWLEPGGYLLANEPQPANALIRSARRVRARIDTSYSSQQEEISSAELRRLFEGAGLVDVTIIPQGLASTPFAELVLRPFVLMAPLAHVACAVDDVLESCLGSWAATLSWNLVASGRRPISS
jgi:2-polyprenyl-3-methyl-5-hydroxy-6-metoxy-1,4-benzoquinol methylase